MREFTKFISGILGVLFIIALIITGFSLLFFYLNWLGKVLKF